MSIVKKWKGTPRRWSTEKILKANGNALLEELVTLFNECLEKGDIPEKWTNS